MMLPMRIDLKFECKNARKRCWILYQVHKCIIFEVDKVLVLMLMPVLTCDTGISKIPHSAAQS